MGDARQKIAIVATDMPETVAKRATEVAVLAMERHTIERDVAAYVKKQFDEEFDPTWHCIVGRHFGSYVTHESKTFIYFRVGPLAVLLFKSG